MAHRTKKSAPVAAEPSSAADDLLVLKPEATLKIAGREITVREYSYFDGLEVAHQASAFIEDMLGMCANGTLRWTAIRRLIGVHRDVVITIAARAAEVEPDWVRSLKPADAEYFFSTWFTVNAGFFVREVAVEIEEVRVRERMRSQTPSSTSSSASPTSGSATSTGSVASPSDS